MVSRFGRAIEFSVRDVSSVSRSLGWIVLYDKEFKTLEKWILTWKFWTG